MNLGPTACNNVTLLSATTLTCITQNPGTPKPLGPLPVTITFADRGSALPVNSTPGTPQISYEFVDLWSRRTTWGGGDPPIEGDSVLIPAGTTVLLDVSPPALYAVGVEGNLRFDDEAADLEFQVRSCCME